MRRNDRAFMLPEAMVWLALIIVMISLSSVLVASFLDTTRAATRAVAGAETQVGAIERVGADVRSSTRVELARAPAPQGRSGAAGIVLIDPAGGRVGYSFDQGVLCRETRAGGANVRVPLGRLAPVSFRAGNPSAEAPGFVEIDFGGPAGRTASHRFYLLREERP